MSDFTCFKCGDGNTPLYCLNCANDMRQSELAPVSLLAAVERLRDTWCDRADYLERLVGYNDDMPAQFNKAQARVLRECIGELYRAMEAANNRTEP